MCHFILEGIYILWKTPWTCLETVQLNWCWPYSSHPLSSYWIITRNYSALFVLSPIFSSVYQHCQQTATMLRILYNRLSQNHLLIFLFAFYEMKINGYKKSLGKEVKGHMVVTMKCIFRLNMFAWNKENKIEAFSLGIFSFWNIFIMHVSSVTFETHEIMSYEEDVWPVKRSWVR